MCVRCSLQYGEASIALAREKERGREREKEVAKERERGRERERVCMEERERLKQLLEEAERRRERMEGEKESAILEAEVSVRSVAVMFGISIISSSSFHIA